MILICRGIADAADPAADGAARAAFDAVSREDPDGIVATGAPGYVDDFVAVGEIRGHDAVRAYFRELFAAFPDFTMTVARIVADDTTAVVQWHAAGMFIARSACCQASHPRRPGHAGRVQREDHAEPAGPRSSSTQAIPDPITFRGLLGLSMLK